MKRTHFFTISCTNLVSGSNPNASQFDVESGDPVVDVLSVDDDELSSLSSASRYGLSPSLPFSMQLQNAGRQAISVSHSVDLQLDDLSHLIKITQHFKGELH